MTCVGVSAFVCLGWSNTKPRRQRIFFYLCAMINFVAAISYFTKGSNLGWAAIPVQFLRSDSKVGGITRQIFYVRYIDGFITTPLLLLTLFLTCALPWPTIFYTIAWNEIMIVMGLVGALVPTRYKWGFFVFGCAAFFFVAYTVIFEGRAYARSLGNDIHRVYLMCAAYQMALWVLYPIAWGLSEGGNVIASDSEAIFYGVLDLLTKPVFTFLLLWGHRNIDIGRLGLYVRSSEDSPLGNHPHGTHEEKGQHNGVTNGSGAPTGVNDGTSNPHASVV
jgi:bacteriorhodopsin